MDKDVEILLVEDSSSDAEMTIDALQMGGFRHKIFHLKNGALALDYLFGEGAYINHKIVRYPRVILLDLKMPKISGIEVLRIIRADERTKRIPVVILTSSREDPDMQQCYDIGVNSYVVKPVEFDQFQKEISDLGLYWMVMNQQPQ